MTPQTVYPTGSRLIQFSSEINGLNIQSDGVFYTLSEYFGQFGDNYV